MIPSIEKIELSIMKYRDFSFRQNLIVFKVSDWSNVVNHECDCLLMSKSGYLTEIEIKRSYEDFLADFKKKHEHHDNHIKYFYFMIHKSFAEKALNKLVELRKIPSLIYIYDNQANISLYKTEQEIKILISKKESINPWELADLKYYADPWHARKLFLEEQYQLARLGAMRYKNMTEKVIKLNNSNLMEINK